MEALVSRQPLDGDDFIPLRLYGEDHAGFHRRSIPHYGARAAAANDAT
jgi:hypothetical protein